MTIVRNGQDIELTAEEIEKAYRIRDAQYHAEDIKAHAKKKGIDITDEKAEELTGVLDNILEHCDGYFEYYWSCVEEALNSL